MEWQDCVSLKQKAFSMYFEIGMQTAQKKVFFIFYFDKTRWQS